MTSVSSVFGIIVAALAIMGAAGLAYAVFTDRTNKERVNGLRGDLEDLRKRNKDLEDDRERKDETIAEQTREIAAMAVEVKSLTDYRDAQAGPLRLITELLQQVVDSLSQTHTLVQAHHDTARAGFAAIELQNADQLRMLGDRRVAGSESITREAAHE